MSLIETMICVIVRMIDLLKLEENPFKILSKYEDDSTFYENKRKPKYCS